MVGRCHSGKTELIRDAAVMEHTMIKMLNYDTFRCSADRCPFTCCQQWKISVDEETEARWKKMGMGKAITTKDESRVIRLNQKGSCPYLNEEKLCRLVLEHGDGMIPTTCQVFPRQVHTFSDRTEYALVACCPDVVDWLVDAEEVVCAKDLAWPPKEGETDAMRTIRDWMICQVQDKRYTVEENLSMLFFILLELYHSGEADLVSRLKACVAEMPQLVQAMRQVPVDEADTVWERNELFLDVTENYWKQNIYREQLAPFREKAEQVADETLEIEMGLSQYDRLFRNYLVCELFANALLPESGLTELILMVQWIIMEYSLICHGLCMQMDELSWTKVREWIVVMARMTGYDLADIEEYFENSFESVIWEWGYAALLLGK